MKIKKKIWGVGSGGVRVQGGGGQNYSFCENSKKKLKGEGSWGSGWGGQCGCE